MINIGQELKDARSRLGFSIKEAAEATKVRAEYLAKLEDNSFDIPLDTVYVRGFLRLYSKYLKLDPDRITDAYNRMQMKDKGEDEVGQEREALGTFSLNTGMEESAVKGDSVSVDGFGSLDSEDGRSPWMVPLAVGGVLAVVFAGILLVRLFFFGTEGSVAGNTETADSQGPGLSGAKFRSYPKTSSPSQRLLPCLFMCRAQTTVAFFFRETYPLVLSGVLSGVPSCQSAASRLRIS